MKRRTRKGKKDQKTEQNLSYPYKFASHLLGGMKSGRLDYPKEELVKHLKELNSDSRKGKSLGQCS